MTATPHTYRELAYRAADGVEVGLFWSTSDDALRVIVDDARSGDLFELVVEPEHALDAFEHPYAYAAHRGIDYAAGNRVPVYA
jgi:murein DD-endopeptidase MepM/ murein hydrolase activator NlpD